MTDVQLDLFGEVETQAQAQVDRAAVLARQQAEFDRLTAYHPDGTPVLWTAPWDTGGGMKAGETRPGRRCPHCGQIEPGEGLLSINHGWDVLGPWRWERPTCTRQELLARQAEVDAARTT